MANMYSGPPSENSEDFKSIEKEQLRKEVVDTLFDDQWVWNGQTREDIPALMKWMLDFGSKGEKAYEPKGIKEDLMGQMRGILGERISGLVAISEAETVFSTLPQNEVNTLEFAAMDSIPFGPNKFTIIKNAVMNASEEATADYELPELLHERNMATDLLLNEPQTYRAALLRDPRFESLGKLIPEDLTSADVLNWLKSANIPRTSEYTTGDMRRDLITEMTEGYARSKVNELDQDSRGIFYDSTTAPDAVLMANNSLVGVIEAKMYMPYEFDLILNSIQKSKKVLGRDGFSVTYTNAELSAGAGYEVHHRNQEVDFKLDIDGEFDLVNILRTHNDNNWRLEDMVFMLRVPSDLPNEKLQEFGNALKQSGRKYVVIQKLPFTTAEINAMSVDYIEPVIEKLQTSIGNKKEVNFRGKKFNKTDIEALQEILH